MKIKVIDKKYSEVLAIPRKKHKSKATHLFLALPMKPPATFVLTLLFVLALFMTMLGLLAADVLSSSTCLPHTVQITASSAIFAPQCLQNFVFIVCWDVVWLSIVETSLFLYNSF